MPPKFTTTLSFPHLHLCCLTVLFTYTSSTPKSSTLLLRLAFSAQLWHSLTSKMGDVGLPKGLSNFSLYLTLFQRHAPQSPIYICQHAVTLFHKLIAGMIMLGGVGSRCNTLQSMSLQYTRGLFPFGNVWHGLLIKVVVVLHEVCL